MNGDGKMTEKEIEEDDKFKCQAIAIARRLKEKGLRDFDHDWIYDQILDAIREGN